MRNNHNREQKSFSYIANFEIHVKFQLRHLIFRPKQILSWRSSREKQKKTKRAEKMTESEGKREKMVKKGGNLLAFTGAAAFLAIAANLAITAFKYHKQKNAKKKGTHSSFFFFFLTLQFFSYSTLLRSVNNKLLKTKIVLLKPLLETCRSRRF